MTLRENQPYAEKHEQTAEKSKNFLEIFNRTIRPAVLGRAHSRIYVTQQDLRAALPAVP